MRLDWILECRSTPLEVTRQLQELADEYGYAADQMHHRKQEIIEVLNQRGKGYITKFLFPNSWEDEERWLQALICMEIRRLYYLTKGEEHGFTTIRRGM